MGCVYGKCCSRFRRSSGGDNNEELGVYPGQNTHILAKPVEIVNVPSHDFRLEYSVLTQRGYYPETPGKENQDSYCIRTNIRGNPDVHFFGVFDGHGQFGTECSSFVKDRLVEILSNDAALLVDPVKAYSAAFLATNDELHNSDIDDSMSGTTAITALMIGDKLYVANVGDSRAVLAVKEGNKIVAQDLSRDQTPFRVDECERVKLCGARVLSVDQVEGLKDPGIQSWGDEETEGGDPPRLWVQDGMYPGTAFTRSVGDRLAEKIGVVADPEVSMVELTAKHPFFVVASDGVFEFLPSQTVVDMVTKYADPRDACSAIAAESYKLWLEHENRTDDITIILVQIKDLTNVHRNEAVELILKDLFHIILHPKNRLYVLYIELYTSMELLRMGILAVWRLVTVFCSRINYSYLERLTASLVGLAADFHQYSLQSHTVITGSTLVPKLRG